MAEGRIVQVAPAWAPIGVVLLLGVAFLGASLAGVLTARSSAQPMASGARAPWRETARLLRQRRRVSVAADRLLWRGGSGTFLVAAILMVAVIPLGRWTLADLPIGIVWFNAMDVLIWAGAWLTGWGANAAHALIGGYRFLAQALAYELPLMFALTTPAVAASSLRIADVVAAQSGLWFVVWMPVAFVVFCLGVLAFSTWGPFSSAAANDIAGGILAELSGPDRFLVLAGRYALLAAGSAFGVTVFLGGGSGPWLVPWAWFLLKTVLLLGCLVIAGHRLPLVRPDRFVEVGWLVLIPATLLQLLIVSLVVAGRG